MVLGVSSLHKASDKAVPTLFKFFILCLCGCGAGASVHVCLCVWVDELVRVHVETTGGWSVWSQFASTCHKPRHIQVEGNSSPENVRNRLPGLACGVFS